MTKEEMLEILEPLIRKTVDDAIDEHVYNGFFKRAFERFISNTTEEQREHLWKSMYIGSFTRLNPLNESNAIHRGDVYNAYDAVEYIKQKYPDLEDEQITIEKKANGNVSFIIILPNKDTVVDDLIYNVGRLGYYVGRKGYRKYGPFLWAVYQFEPKSQPNVRSKILSDYNVLIHVTPAENLKSIKKNGLVPKQSDDYNNDHFAYPERTYILCSRNDANYLEYAENTAYTFYTERKDDGNFPYENNRYCHQPTGLKNPRLGLISQVGD
jgi:hypothetical protein